MIDDTEKPALEILQPDWDDICPNNVDALMTLRAGGVSSGLRGAPELPQPPQACHH